MKKLLLFLLLAVSCQTKYPEVIHLEGKKLHIQGLALDKKEKCLYCSFTSAFFKCDLEGNVIGSVTGINGHLGAMTYEPKSKKVYASLEIKDDEIGRGVSDALGAERHEKAASRFYVAEIDVRKIDRLEVPFEEAMTLHPIEEVAKDYLDTVEVNGVTLEHKYGCSGMDGVAIAPGFGAKGKEKFLYVAYGVYGDTTRVDNDYNILLCFKMDDLAKPVHKYFVKTGNTRYGVQNMTYDADSERLYLAVYKGSKSQYPNYSLFSLDIHQKPFMGKLENVPYEENEVEQVSVTEGSFFKWGSTGLYSFGDGRWYISKNGKKDGYQFSDVTLFESLEE
jgi:hypothetical protein